MKSKIWLSPPHIGKKELPYIKQAFNSNWITTSGENVDSFEASLASYMGNNTNVAVLNSGTAAIHLALIRLGVKENDEVLCQSFTFCGTANPIVYLKAKPVFIDSEQDTLNMCPKFLREAIQDRIKHHVRPKAIIVVHLYGTPAKMDEIRDIANQYKIPIIEDAAEALGATYKSKKCGSLTEYGILSFNGNKIITTSGGGALICKSEEEKQAIIHLATQAKDKAPHYQHTAIGYNYRLSNVLAGIGRAQLEKLNKRLKKLKKTHKFYKSIFKDSKNISLFTPKEKDIVCNFWLNIIFLNNKTNFSISDVMSHLEDLNIEARPLWKPMHLQPVFKDNLFYGNSISEDFFKSGICLPSGSNLSKQDKARIAQALQKFI